MLTFDEWVVLHRAAGAWDRDRKHGFGQLRWTNKDVFSGEWVDDTMYVRLQLNLCWPRSQLCSGPARVDDAMYVRPQMNYLYRSKIQLCSGPTRMCFLEGGLMTQCATPANAQQRQQIP